VEVLTGRGFALLDLGDLNGALASFTSAHRTNPRFLDAILGLAETYREKGNTQKALEFYRRYLDTAPDGPEANLARSMIERLKSP